VESKAGPPLLPRAATRSLAAALRVNPVVVVLGARQTGKTTLVRLFRPADTVKHHKEAKFAELLAVLGSSDVIRAEDEKLLIFTEHRDTLKSLAKRLEAEGYTVATIHGGMDVDSRKRAQRQFRTRTKIMVATDAAGEGNNLQFCRCLINWDIPWNPNRLEQGSVW
jgi:superfamily II DNA/RNA helicase